MSGYIGRRLLGVCLNLVLVSIFAFMMLRLVPGDVTRAILGQNATEEQVVQFKQEHGLDDSAVDQYFNWAGGILTGDLGTSLRSNIQISDEFLERLPVTLEIVILSFSFTTTLGVSIGLLSAIKQNTLADYGARLVAIFGLSIPTFLLLTLLLILPARWWNYGPPFGATDFFADPWDNLRLFVPPTALLAIGSSAGLMRLTRSAYLEVMRQDFIRTARAKGLTESSVTLRHGLRNALPPIMTLAGFQLGNLLGGSVIVEQVFALPGLGTWALNGIQLNDYPVVMAVSLYSAILLMTISLVVDIMYAWADPRIRYS